MRPREEEPPRRKKEREADSSKSGDKERHRSSKKTYRKHSSPNPSRSRSRDRTSERSHLSRLSMSDLPSRSKKVTMAVPEMERRSSVGDPKTASYPSFSKAHSREAVGSREEVSKPKVSILTPDPTDVSKGDRTRTTRPRTPAANSPTRAPPSPPLTADEGDLRRQSSDPSGRRSTDSTRHDRGARGVDSGSRTHASRLRADTGSSPRKSSKSNDSDSSTKTDSSKPSTVRAGSEAQNRHHDLHSHLRESDKRSASGSSLRSSATNDSQATSVAPDRKTAHPMMQQIPTRDDSPQSRYEAAPKTPTAQEQFPSNVYQQRPSSAANPSMASPMRVSASTPGVQAATSMPPPPPPPPPVNLPLEVPRVDYLLQNGGLPYLIPKVLLTTPGQASVQSYQQYMSPRIPQGYGQAEAAQVFAPITKRLEDLTKVLNKSGSVAVATGYRSVARRLLDRLEHVFARNISSEKCHCVVCGIVPQPEISEEEEDGISWGEILEFVSGRKELPQWPPFNLDTEGLGISMNDRVGTPMQRLDPDVPVEYRDHYLRQNDKTKRTVQTWLQSQQADSSSSPPNDVDDETLSFAMLTRLDAEKRPLFTALMKGSSNVPISRAPTPTDGVETKNAVLEQTALALERLYRLRTRPRDPECTLFLLNNLYLHSVLATIAAISPAEWDILTSGRFDGFLWSGAEAPMPAFAASNISRGPSRGPTPLSRGPTPFSPLRNVASPAPNGQYMPSRGGTPAPGSAGAGMPAPVRHDEETEIAVLAEVEREIYRGMELLEDQFEHIHQQAETLRQKLRERSAGLAMAAQARRGSQASEPEVRIGTPASGWGGIDGLDEQEGIFDDVASLAPDDSASNISYARRRRHKDRQRRTPAAVEEEDEDGEARRRRR